MTSNRQHALKRWASFAAGLLLIAHETTIAGEPRAELVATALALIGLPVFSRPPP